MSTDETGREIPADDGETIDLGPVTVTGPALPKRESPADERQISVTEQIPAKDDTSVYLYQWLKGARERLCRAQMLVSRDDMEILQGALDRIDLVGCDLPEWSRHDGGRA